MCLFKRKRETSFSPGVGRGYAGRSARVEAAVTLTHLVSRGCQHPREWLLLGKARTCCWGQWLGYQRWLWVVSHPPPFIQEELLVLLHKNSSTTRWQCQAGVCQSIHKPKAVESLLCATHWVRLQETGKLSPLCCPEGRQSSQRKEGILLEKGLHSVFQSNILSVVCFLGRFIFLSYKMPQSCIP